MKKVVAVMSLLALLALVSCKASGPGTMETSIATQAKKVTIGGKNVPNPAPDTQAAIDEGRGHFQHHCQICHGNDGHNTGVPFADKMSPPVADLGDKDIQGYTDGQLHWIIENGIRLTGMPGWKGVLEDDEMWKITRFIRHLPAKGSAGIPEIFKEEQEEHEQMEKGMPMGMPMGKPGEAAPHSHGAKEPPHQH